MFDSASVSLLDGKPAANGTYLDPSVGCNGHALRAAVKHLLCPVRLAPSDRDAVQLAAQLGPAFRARITFLHVLPPEEAATSLHWLDAIDRLYRQLLTRGPTCPPSVDTTRATMLRFLDEHVRAELRQNLRFEVDCRFGDVADEIIRFAECQDVDLIVLNARPRGWRHAFRPSLARRIMQQTSKPVLLAPASLSGPEVNGRHESR